MLQFKEVQKSLGGKLILDIPSLQLNKGIYWLQGANGSGKTTLLRMIAGILPFKGDIFFNLIICLLAALWFTYQFHNPGKSSTSVFRYSFDAFNRKRFYWLIFIRYLFHNRTLVLFGIKLYTCAVLYLLIKNVTPDDYDIAFPFIFYSFGLLGHSIIVHHLRDFEENKHSLPVSKQARFIQYALLYFALLIPKLATICLLTPVFIHIKDAFAIIACSYSVLLLLNALLFAASYKMDDYLKICLLIFIAIWIGAFSNLLLWLPSIFIGISVRIFNKRYYKYEISEQTDHF